MLGTLVNLNHDQLMPIVSVAAAAGLAVFAVCTHRSKSSAAAERGLKEIPMPKGALPYFGHLLALGDLPAHQTAKWSKEYGPIFKIKMGVQTWIMISDPYIAHEIFNTNGSVTSNRPFQLFSHEIYSLNQKGVAFPNPGKVWKRTRTAALDVLAPKNVDRFSDILEREADYIVKYLIAATIANGHVDTVKPLQSASMNVVLTTCLGMRAESVLDPLFKEVVAVTDEGMKLAGAAEDMSSFLPILSVLDILFRKERRMRNFAENKRNPLYRRLIREALASDKDCLLKSLYELKDQYNLDDDDIMVTINDLIAAGADTIAVSLSWGFAILCHYPDVQKKLRDEVDAFIAVHKRLPTFAEREQLPYLISVQKECMRYRPTTPFGVLHENTEDLEIRGYFIPKGSVLVSNMYGMHANPNIYPEPEKFKPERFLNNLKTMSAAANSRIEGRDQYNFGWGRRICPGIHLAEVEMYNVYVRVFANAIIEPMRNSDNEPVYPNLDKAHDGGLVYHPIESTVRFVERKDALL